MAKYEWLLGILFSGLGATIIGGLLFNSYKKKHIQKQRSGKRSLNVQVGKNLNIKSDPKNE